MARAPRLRIAQLAPPDVPVPPRRYGGTELVVSLLTEELVRRGQEVTLFASGDSCTSARLVPTVESALWQCSEPLDSFPYALKSVDMVFERASEFDIIHNHLGLTAYPAARRTRSAKTLTTVHGRLDLKETVDAFMHFRTEPLVSISDNQRAPLPWAYWLGTVYHGIDVCSYEYREQHEDYLAFLGRFTPDKGVDTAINVARCAGLPIKLAGRLPLNQPTPDCQRDWQYFNEVIQPLLCEPDVEYVGELDGCEKAAFLADAAALLFPISWPEPFGLVMVEALACGTPVIGTACGSVPEVITHGVTGFVVKTEDELVQACRRATEISRAGCRAEAERRFSVATMADAYEALYERLLQDSGIGAESH